jgi:hypothetical protein
MANDVAPRVICDDSPSFAFYIFVFQYIIILVHRMVNWQFGVISFFPVFIALSVLWLRFEDRTIHLQLFFLFALSLIGFIASQILIPVVSQLCLKAKLFGKDINKGGVGEMYVL